VEVPHEAFRFKRELQQLDMEDFATSKRARVVAR
jgi:hypothetical protein